MKSQLLGLLRHRFARKPARSCDWHVAFVLDVKIKYQKPKKLIGIGFWLKFIYILKRIPSIEVLIQWGNSTHKQKIPLERKVSFTNRPPSPLPRVSCMYICVACIVFVSTFYYLFHVYTHTNWTTSWNICLSGILNKHSL